MEPLHVKIQRKQRPLTKRKTKKCHINEPPTYKLIKGIIEQIPNKKEKGPPSKNIKLKKEGKEFTYLIPNYRQKEKEKEIINERGT